MPRLSASRTRSLRNGGVSAGVVCLVFLLLDRPTLGSSGWSGGWWPGRAMAGAGSDASRVSPEADVAGPVVDLSARAHGDIRVLARREPGGPGEGRLFSAVLACGPLDERLGSAHQLSWLS